MQPRMVIQELIVTLKNGKEGDKDIEGIIEKYDLNQERLDTLCDIIIAIAKNDFVTVNIIAEANAFAFHGLKALLEFAVEKNHWLCVEALINQNKAKESPLELYGELLSTATKRNRHSNTIQFLKAAIIRNQIEDKNIDQETDKEKDKQIKIAMKKSINDLIKNCQGIFSLKKHSAESTAFLTAIKKSLTDSSITVAEIIETIQNFYVISSIKKEEPSTLTALKKSALMAYINGEPLVCEKGNSLRKSVS